MAAIGPADTARGVGIAPTSTATSDLAKPTRTFKGAPSTADSAALGVQTRTAFETTTQGARSGTSRSNRMTGKASQAGSRPTVPVDLSMAEMAEIGPPDAARGVGLVSTRTATPALAQTTRPLNHSHYTADSAAAAASTPATIRKGPDLVRGEPRQQSNTEGQLGSRTGRVTDSLGNSRRTADTTNPGLAAYPALAPRHGPQPLHGSTATSPLHEVEIPSQGPQSDERGVPSSSVAELYPGRPDKGLDQTENLDSGHRKRKHENDDLLKQVKDEFETTIKALKCEHEEMNLPAAMILKALVNGDNPFAAYESNACKASETFQKLVSLGQLQIELMEQKTKEEEAGERFRKKLNHITKG